VSLLLLLATVPSLAWVQPVETAPALRQAGVERLYVPPEAVAAWQKAGFTVLPWGDTERAARVALEVPGIAGRAQMASATSRPWVDANGWRFVRNPEGRFRCDVPARSVALAAAEAFAYGADVVLGVEPRGLEDFGRVLSFVRSMPAVDLPPAADVAIEDDGSDTFAEVLNLMARANLLFRVGPATGADVPLHVRIGSTEFPRESAEDPAAFALSVRRHLTDEKRSLRVYGSEAVLGRLVRDASRARLHLLNYGGRPIEGLRVRLLGTWAQPQALVFGEGQRPVEDYVTRDGATEFSLPILGPYAVIDLAGAR
jgi:hypothetical protein